MSKSCCISPWSCSLTNPLPSPFRADSAAMRFSKADFPRTLARFVWRIGAWDQFWLCLISLSVSVLDTVPMEIQRRIVDQTVYSGNFRTILVLAVVYAGVVLTEGIVKLLMNIYRGWIAENAVRILRSSITLINDGERQDNPSASERGVEAAIIVAEVEPIGGFAGDALSEPLLQVGTLVSVFGYLTFLNPLMALASAAAFSPQVVFVPLMQRAINQRVRRRIAELRAASANLVDEHVEAVRLTQEARFQEVFRLNMGIFEFKYSLNFLMNLTMNLGTIGILVMGSWYVVKGSIEVGTMVAFVSGLRSVSNPWGSLVSWFQTAWVTASRYDLLQDTIRAEEIPKAAGKAR
jgi:ABC-type bacteriocin/lantibiotic exporter with double-glycine peptidase domain